MNNIVELCVMSVILVVLPLLRPKFSTGAAFNLKDSVLYILAMLYLGYMLITGVRVVLSPIFVTLSLLAVYATTTAIWTTNNDQTWREIVKWWALVAMFIMAQSIPVNNLFAISLVAVPVIFAWGCVQLYGYEPYDETLTKYNKDLRELKEPNFRWSMGNLNHAGAFLAPYLFINIYLAINVSHWYFVVIPFIVTGVFLTHCWSAMAGMYVGLCFIYPPYSLTLLGAIPIGLACYFILRKKHAEYFDKKIYSLKTRSYYWLMAFNLWKNKPIFGWGLKTYSKELFECQAEENLKDPSLLGYKDSEKDIKPKYIFWPERVHNDAIEMLCEGGLVGFILILSFMASIIYVGIVTQNYIVLGGALCLMVHGMLFYTLSSFSVVPYMVLLGALAGQRPVEFYAVPLPLSILGALVILNICYEKVIKPQIARMYSHKAMNVIEGLDSSKIEDVEKGARLQHEYINKAYEYAPKNGKVLFVATNMKSNQDSQIALHLAESAIHNYDGEMRLPELFGRYGDLQFQCGNVSGAKRAMEYAIYLNPRLSGVRKSLQQVKRIEHDIEEQKIRVQKEKRNQQLSRLVNPLKVVGA